MSGTILIVFPRDQAHFPYVDAVMKEVLQG